MKRTIEEQYGLKPLAVILKLPTKRLLRYYKTERHHSYKFQCGCCGEWIWVVQDRPDLKEEYDSLELRLEAIKKELNTREHVPIKVKKPKKIFTGGRKKKFRRLDAIREREQHNSIVISTAKEELRSYIRNLYK